MTQCNTTTENYDDVYVRPGPEYLPLSLLEKAEVMPLLLACSFQLHLYCLYFFYGYFTKQMRESVEYVTPYRAENVLDIYIYTGLVTCKSPVCHLSFSRRGKENRPWHCAVRDRNEFMKA